MGLFTLKPKTPEAIEPYIELQSRPPIQCGINIRNVSPLTYFTLRKSLKGPANFWPSNESGCLGLRHLRDKSNIEELTKSGRLIMVFKPGHMGMFDGILPRLDAIMGAVINPEEDSHTLPGIPLRREEQIRVIARTAFHDIQGLAPKSEVTVRIVPNIPT